MARGNFFLKNMYWFCSLLGMVVFVGCAGSPTVEVKPAVSESSFSSVSDRVPNISGLWEYHQGEVVYDLLLDHLGNGTYDWQGGRFKTVLLTQEEWRGTWVQEGNDREGGFEAHLADDGMSAHGRWWYTRIGHDSDPLEPGSEFMLRRSVTPKENNENNGREPSP